MSLELPHNPIQGNKNSSVSPVSNHRAEPAEQPKIPEEQGALRTEFPLPQTKTVTKLTSSVKPFLRYLGNMIARDAIIVFSVKKGLKFVVSTKDAKRDLKTVWGRRKFGDSEITNARNIARKDVLRHGGEDGKDLRSVAEELRSKVREKIEKKEISKVAITGSEVDDENIESGINNGICFGLNLDTVYRYLVLGENIDDIIESNKKGGRAEAAANQIVYSMIRSSLSGADRLNCVFDGLNRLAAKDPKHELLDCDFGHVRSAFFYLAGGGKDDADSPFNQLVNSVFEREMAQAEKDGSHPFLEKKKDEWVVSDPQKFKEAALAEINEKFNGDMDALGQNPDREMVSDLLKEREANIKELNWTVSYLEFLKGINEETEPEKKEAPKPTRDDLRFDPTSRWELRFVNDPIRGACMQELLDVYRNRVRQDVVASMRGIEKVPVESFGLSNLHTHDEPFLNDIDKLPDGAYGIGFATDDGLHVITYIKKGDAVRILDPNGPQLGCHKDQAKELILAILDNYAEPLQHSSLYKEGKMNHLLEISEFRAAKQASAPDASPTPSEEETQD